MLRFEKITLLSTVQPVWLTAASSSLDPQQDGESEESGGAENSPSVEKAEGPAVSGGVLIEGQSGP